MGSSSFLVERLDFSVGREFEHQVRRHFGSQVHHDSSSPRGSFLLLATFRHSLFRLSEDSVALVLQSFLGGSAHLFHVLEVSHNHFCFSVSCKAVGFFVYGLRRVIGESFDVYFHLWSNGTPHWEREKHLWEAEEAKKWTAVLTMCQKRDAKAHASATKRVHFNPQLILASPTKKFEPAISKARTICFGSISTAIDHQAQIGKSFIIGSSNQFS